MDQEGNVTDARAAGVDIAVVPICIAGINMFYKQIILNRGLPFEVKIPTARPVNVSELTEAELNAELEKGYADMTAGRTKPAKQVFTD